MQRESYSPDRLGELLYSDDLPTAITEAAAAVDHFDELKAQATSDDEWEALHRESEPWEDALSYFEQQHRALMGLRRVRLRQETGSAMRSRVLARRVRVRPQRRRIRVRRPSLRSRRRVARRSNSRSSMRDPSDPGPCGHRGGARQR